MKDKKQIYKELKELIIKEYVIKSDANNIKEKDDVILDCLQERIKVLEEILEVIE